MARSSPNVPDTIIRGMAGHLACMIFNAEIPSKAGSVQSDSTKSMPPRWSAAIKSSRFSTQVVAHAMPSASRVDLTSAASFGSSSKCRIWRRDFTFGFFPSERNEFVEAWRRPFAQRYRRWFIDHGPEHAEQFDCRHKLAERHRLHHVGVDPQFVALHQIRRFTRGGKYDHRNDLQGLVGLDDPQHLQPGHLGHLEV